MATSSLSLRFAPTHNPNNSNNSSGTVSVPSLIGSVPSSIITNPSSIPSSNNNALQLSPNSSSSSILLTDHLVTTQHHNSHHGIQNALQHSFDHPHLTANHPGAHQQNVHHGLSHSAPGAFLPHQHLMTAVVDTSHHSILSSIADDFDDKFPFSSSDDVKPNGASSGSSPPPPNTNGHSGAPTTNSTNRGSSESSSTATATTTTTKSSNSSKLKQEREILNNDIIVSEGQNDVTIEYMDLDEFLHENGLSNVCKGSDGLLALEPQQIPPPPLSHTQIHHNSATASSLEKHYPINLQHRGASSPSNNSNNNNNNDDLLVATDLLLAQQQERLSSASTVSPSSPPTTTTCNNNTLTCIIPPQCQNGNLNVFSPDYQHMNNRQCSPGGGSSNSLSSPSSSDQQPNLGSVVIGGRGRRRSSTKSIDSGRSISPSTEGEGPLLHKNGLEPRIIKRSKKEMVPDIKKDANYWKKREKNNLAAKRSRDSRREREAQISYKTKFLENENANLQQKLEKCLRQNEDLKKRLSKYEPI